MLQDHPKGIYVAFAINVGERFGFYIMMAILSLFLQTKYGLSVSEAGDYYSWFYFAIYATALFGGLAADWMQRYKSVVLVGQIMMIAGYIAIAMPFMPFYGSLLALLTIALGNGLFKGNLQVVVGQLYDDERYAKLRDSAFLFFYMGVNVGAFAAPFIAAGIRNWWLNQHGFFYDGNLALLCQKYLSNTLGDTSQLIQLAQEAVGDPQVLTNISEFAHRYIEIFTQGYNWTFAIAALTLIFSLFVNIVFNKNLPENTKPVRKRFSETFGIKQPLKKRKVTTISALLIFVSIILFQLIPGLDVSGKWGISLAIGLFIAFIAFIFLMSTDEERPKVIALISLFVVTIFFWMSFNQNGLALTQFALEYTRKEVTPFTNLFFDFKSILCVILVLVGLGLMLHTKSTLRYRFIGGVMAVVFSAVCYYFMSYMPQRNAISPELFQAFNPLFILLLMPLVIGLFGLLNKYGMKPSAPRKIAIGLIIAGLAFVLLLISSLPLVSPYKLQDTVLNDDLRVSPYWLIGTYAMLTVAEVFLSPMGMSLVSRVSPKRFRGLMQGGWLFTTAVGNKLLFLGGYLWDKVELYTLWGIFAACCIISAVLVFSVIKRLEKSTY